MELTEQGFVFLNANGRPMWCRTWHGKPWLFYWHADNHWTSSRELTEKELSIALSFAARTIDSYYYHKLHAIWEEEQVSPIPVAYWEDA